MTFRLVKGEIALFRPTANGTSGSRPDGDSVWFKPDNPNLLKNFNGRSADFNGGGFINLRLEAIDALELHYQGENQLLAPAKKARDVLLKALGFTSVAYGPSGTIVVDSAPAKIRAYILTRGLDGTQSRRPISFLYPGGHPRQDGSNVFLTVAAAGQSMNAELMRKGLVYPLYYETLPPDIRDRFTDLAVNAFNDGKGIWDGTDTSNAFNIVKKMEHLRNLAIWPKLYRRLKDYFEKQPNGNMKKFDTALRNGTDGLKDDPLTIASGTVLDANANMHDIYEIGTNSRIRMKFYPEELIIKGD